MTAAPLTIQTDCRLQDAKSLMHQNKIRHLAVNDNSGIVSVLSLEDIDRVTAPAHGTEDHGLSVGDVCPARAHMADVDDPLSQVLTVMAEKSVNAVLVLREGELAGIFTTTDACRLLAIRLRAEEQEQDS